uniref:F-Box protein n=2 Tax=Solanum tuberosum TaxID=4113 RepID=M1CWH8_SOLTU
MQDSSSTFANLPSELITEIFLRLPVKSLLQYRSVSKYWLDLISSPRFIKSHLSLSTSNKENTHHKWLMVMFNKNMYTRICSLRSLFNDSVTKTSYLNIPMKEPYESYHILSSVNGLICLTCRAGEKGDLILWNPSIRKCRKLPSFESELINVNCYYRCGFIYDELHDDYKVVVILFEHNRSNRIEIKIYSLRSNSWRSVDHSCPPSGYFLNDCGKFVNGKLHWTTLTSGLGYNTKEISQNIVSFDLTDEKWGKAEKPTFGEGDIDSRLEVLGSNLSVFCYNKRRYVSVWVMKEYGVKESWKKMFTINYFDMPYVHEQSYFMSNKGEVLVGFSRSFKIYNPKDNSFSPKTINYDREAAEIYIESLVSPFPSEDQTSDATKIEAKKSSDQDIQVLPPELSIPKVIHIYREQNKLADSLLPLKEAPL